MASMQVDYILSRDTNEHLMVHRKKWKKEQMTETERKKINWNEVKRKKPKYKLNKNDKRKKERKKERKKKKFGEEMKK